MAGRPGGILAYDLSSNVGWAYGHPLDNSGPVFGELILRTISGGEGARFVGFENEIADQVVLYQPQHIVTEAPLSLQAMNNREVAFQQIGLRAFALAEAYRASARYHEMDVYSVRKEVLGTGRFAKGKAKEEVVRWCWKRGWKVGTHNMGDACVLWEFYRTRLSCP